MKRIKYLKWRPQGFPKIENSPNISPFSYKIIEKFFNELLFDPKILKIN